MPNSASLPFTRASSASPRISSPLSSSSLPSAGDLLTPVPPSVPLQFTPKFQVSHSAGSSPPSHELPLYGTPPTRSRGDSVSSLPLPSTDRVISSPSTNSLSATISPSSSSQSSTPSTISAPLPPPTQRPRSHSQSRSLSPPTNREAKGKVVEDGVSQSWWAAFETGHRPWRDHSGSPSGSAAELPLSKRKKTIPAEQTEGYMHTRERVAAAAKAILGPSLDIAHELLAVSVDVLKFAPVAGLSEAAKVLLDIWDSVALVDMNRLACLRLTERCADLLLSVRVEIHEAGDEVGEELEAPIAKLVEALMGVYAFMQKQISQPFLYRYLKRDEILKQIEGCDAELRNALGMFGLSIQIRILKQIQRAERGRQADNQAIIHALNGGNGSGLSDVVTTSPILPATSSATSPILSGAVPTASRISQTLCSLHAAQNEQDAAHDMADLRALLHAALQASGDVEMIEVLQVGREEMPEAIKTLQRALERIGPPEVGLERSMSRKGSGGDGKAKGLKREGTVESTKTSASGGSGRRKDTLDQEFMESGIDALRRLSASQGIPVEGLPSWTITKFEVERSEKIGIGFFSDVYRGTWLTRSNRTVAIKVLRPTTPRSAYVHEVEIWKTLKHPNVLELYGASSASGEAPWFFVCRFCEGGNLVKWLKALGDEDWKAAVGFSANRANGRGVDLIRAMMEIAQGMKYLHGRDVVHGDLKASNVLVNIDRGQPRCILSDFGQSEMKSEVYRLSGDPLHRGTLRWQAPEIMNGHNQHLTMETDVYAFAITCVEILTKGNLPWTVMDDDNVRHLVLKQNMRPPFPHIPIVTTTLGDLVNICWAREPSKRPTFTTIVRELRTMTGIAPDESPRPALRDIIEVEESARPSPDMRPILLPEDEYIVPPEGAGSPTSTSTNTSDSYRTAEAATCTSSLSAIDEIAMPALSSPTATPAVSVSHTEDIGTGAGQVRSPERVVYTESVFGASSVFTTAPEESDTDDEGQGVLDWAIQDGYDSPRPANERTAELRNERRYRLLVTHEFHPSLTLPLWTPTPIALGSVGYLSKPSGQFVALFNMFDPSKSSDGIVQGMPSVHGYGRVAQESLRQDKRNAALRSLDKISGFLTFGGKNSVSVSRRYSFPLRAGHKTAHLCMESTIYRYVDHLEAPKKWFKSNVDSIMKIYGQGHGIQKEDLFLVIGTLSAPDYALFVSHSHPDGQAHFNVFSSPKGGRPWGTFTTDTNLPEGSGPNYDEDVPGNPVSASKVSLVGRSRWDTVLMARLRFKPDVAEPTSL